MALPIWHFAPGELLPAGPYLAGAAWHAHEMVFGFAAAVLTGFLLTAARAWTGLATPTGWRLAALAGLWVAGRVLVATGPAVPAIVVDCLFLPCVSLAERATVHGFRSSVRDWAAECTSAPHAVMELALAHSVGSSVERAYARSDMIEKRRVLMQQWADFMAGGGGEVVRLQG